MGLRITDPRFVTVAIFLVYPMYLMISTSFRTTRGLNLSQINQAPFSLMNYHALLTDSVIWRDLYTSLLYTLLGTGISFAIGLATALLLNKAVYGRRLFRTLILLRWAVPGIATVLGFIWILDSSYGIANYLLYKTGIISEYVKWLTNPDLALFAVTIPTVWKAYPFFTIMLLAALQGIAVELYEASKIDGAKGWQTFKHITWPGIKETAVLAILFNGLWVFKEFDIIYVATGGGPNGATETLPILIYQEAIQYFRLGTASAAGVITLLLCIAAVLSLYPLIKKDLAGGR